MSDAEQPELEAVDRLVGEHLQRQAAELDASALVARVRQLRETAAGDSSRKADAAKARPQRSRRIPRGVAWLAATAAALLLAFLGGRYLGPATAGAATVLRNVQAVHTGGTDRCYQVQYAPDLRYWNPKNKLEGPSQSVLWTRGDRFWADCTIGDLRLDIGQEPDGTLWVTPSRQKGIRFGNDPADLPPDVALIAAINSMSVPRLVDEVLADFDLQTSSGADSSRTLIRATLKPGRTHRLLSDALLEIDTRTNVLVRMVLWTTRKGQPKGTVTYTLVESSPRDDRQYLLASHLDADAKVEVHQLQNNQDK